MAADEPMVTFVIPTMGRDTLTRALESLEAQSIPNWRAIVVFDNKHEVNYQPTSDKVRVMQADVGGHAGLVRNFAFDYVNTEWIAFLDDDDWVLPSYVQLLRGYSPDRDVVVFTYEDVTNGNTQPPKRTKKLEECRVGISFAVRTDFVRLRHIKFTEHSVEDFRFLNSCEVAGGRIFISNNVQYMVGGRGCWLK